MHDTLKKELREFILARISTHNTYLGLAEGGVKRAASFHALKTISEPQRQRAANALKGWEEERDKEIQIVADYRALLATL